MPLTCLTCPSTHPYPATLAHHRPYVGALSPALRQKGAKELFYQRVQAAYRSLLAQVRQAVAAVNASSL